MAPPCSWESILLTINERNNFDRLRVIIDEIIEQYPTQEILERDEKIHNEAKKYMVTAYHYIMIFFFEKHKKLVNNKHECWQKKFFCES
jgi:hypothetical protein